MFYCYVTVPECMFSSFSSGSSIHITCSPCVPWWYRRWVPIPKCTRRLVVSNQHCSTALSLRNNRPLSHEKKMGAGVVLWLVVIRRRFLCVCVCGLCCFFLVSAGCFCYGLCFVVVVVCLFLCVWVVLVLIFVGLCFVVVFIFVGVCMLCWCWFLLGCVFVVDLCAILSLGFPWKKSIEWLRCWCLVTSGGTCTIRCISTNQKKSKLGLEPPPKTTTPTVNRRWNFKQFSTSVGLEESLDPPVERWRRVRILRVTKTINWNHHLLMGGSLPFLAHNLVLTFCGLKVQGNIHQTSMSLWIQGSAALNARVQGTI